MGDHNRSIITVRFSSAKQTDEDIQSVLRSAYGTLYALSVLFLFLPIFFNKEKTKALFPLNFLAILQLYGLHLSRNP